MKTLLGIPYALHHRAAGDWDPWLKPLAIRCGGVEYLPRYRVDPTRQTITFELSQKPLTGRPMASSNAARPSRSRRTASPRDRPRNSPSPAVICRAFQEAKPRWRGVSQPGIT